MEPNSVSVTERAAIKIKEVTEQEGDNYLRIFVQGGGCSGLQYGLKTEKEPSNGDKIVEEHGIRVLIDPISIRYLVGSEIDLEENNLMGGGFKINNPNAKGTCGCGQSFDPK